MPARVLSACLCVRFSHQRLLQCVVLSLTVWSSSAIAQAQTATTTTLAVSPSTTPVPAKTAVTLTATVLAGATPVHPGLVTFCDSTLSSAPVPSHAPCAILNVAGTAQLTSAGTAVLKFVPGGGSHSYTAVFAGTGTYQTSSSSAQAVTVAQALPYSTTTALTSTGSAGNYTLTATVTVTQRAPPKLGGNVSFVDTTNSNYVLGATPLEAVTAASVIGEAPGSPIPVGSSPLAIAIADFDGDGIADLAVTNQGENTVSILLGDGSGGFAPAGSRVPVGSSPGGMATGDFNGDGFADLAVANFNDNNVTILLGNGSGGFTPAPGSPFSAGSNPTNIAVGDFNGDGIADLATPSYNSSHVTVLLGNGSGGFTPAPGSPFPIGSTPQGISVGDFNGDGIADLA